jgi:hypothetical protein
MRWVYHHFTRPAEMNASLFLAARPNGLLAVADFSPTLVDRVAALLKRHELHGIDSGRVKRELSAAGFSFDRELAGWPGRGYCLLFRKPDRAH